MLNVSDPNSNVNVDEACTKGGNSCKRKVDKTIVPEDDQKAGEEHNQPNPKKRKVHEPYRYDGHTYHTNSQSSDGNTEYYECAE